ncbi:MAG: hypothetical protein AAF620_19770 [Bacteroidota bacterium]
MINIRLIPLYTLLAACQSNNNCIEGDCLNGVGKIKFENDGIDSGQFVNGRLDGLGLRVHGEGTYEGDRYEGEFKNNKMDVFGEYYHTAQNLSYRGFFKEGLRHGEGQIVNLDHPKEEIILVL